MRRRGHDLVLGMGDEGKRTKSSSCAIIYTQQVRLWGGKTGLFIHSKTITCHREHEVVEILSPPPRGGLSPLGMWRLWTGYIGTSHARQLQQSCPSANTQGTGYSWSPFAQRTSFKPVGTLGESQGRGSCSSAPWKHARRQGERWGAFKHLIISHMCMHQALVLETGILHQSVI